MYLLWRDSNRMALESYYVRRVEKSRLISLASSCKLHPSLHTRSHLCSRHIQYPKNWFLAAGLEPFPMEAMDLGYDNWLFLG
jgi:hypothetical protein